MSEIVQQIENILDPTGNLKLIQVTDYGGDPLVAVMAVKYNQPKYLFDRSGKNIIGLNLAKTGLTHDKWQQISKITDLTAHLQALHLAENELTTFDTARLQALRHLNLAENAALQTITFPAPLPGLERLDVSECKLTNFAIPAGCNALKYLDLRKNGLKTISLSACPALEFLDASQNKLAQFAMPGGFGALKYLYLNDNILQNFSFETAPRRLSILNLRENKLKDFPANLLSFTSLQALYLHGNAFGGSLSAVVPKEEDGNAYKTVTDYLFALRDGKIPNERVKIIIVGNGRVGKTSMFRRLKNNEFDAEEKPTHGIQLGQLDKSSLPNVKTSNLQANVWDFGGQEIFYATHQFFLTDDALYILAWTAKENIASYLERDRDVLPGEEKWRENGYWLENIRHHSKNSPLLMVQTHTDLVRTTVPAEYTGDPFRAESLDFCAADGDGLAGLKRVITERLNKKIPHLGEEFPIAYDKVIGELEKIQERNKITRTDFNEICRNAEVRSDAEESVLEFLRLTGTVVWFKEIAVLRETVFINPNWLAKQVYCLINKELEGKRGRIRMDWVEKMLPEYSVEERIQLLELLKEFRLIFEEQENKEIIFIAPQYLPEFLEQDAQVQFDKTKRRLAPAIFAFRFPQFVPDNVMVNFLSHYGPYADKVYTKNKISFTKLPDEKGIYEVETDCIVEFDEDNRELQVFTHSHALQAEVCHAFVNLSKNANAEIALHGKPFVSWQELADAQSGSLAEIWPIDRSSKVTVRDYDHFFKKLESVEKGMDVPNKSVKTTHQQPVIYFSYAHGDNNEPGESREKIVDELYHSLKEGGMDVRRDKMNLGYAELISTFMKEIGQGDLVVVFVSDKYAKSPYCMFELYEIARNCRFEKEEFSRRVLPIPFEFVQFDDAKVLDRYLDHWEEQEKDWTKIRDRGLATPAQDRRYQITKKIKNEFGELVDYLADMNQSTTQLLREEDFEIVKQAILNRVGRHENP